jgi:hypothetical protein
MGTKIHDNYVIDIDSDERDPAKYPNPNDYVIRLNRSLYDVSNLKVVSARVPQSQSLINQGNRQIVVNSTVVLLTEGNYTGSELATQLATDLAATPISTVTYEAPLRRLHFTSASDVSFKFYTGSNGFSVNSTYGQPYEALGFNALDTPPSSDFYSNVVDLSGASSLILRITSNRGDITKPVFLNNGEFSFGSNVYNSKPGGNLNMHYFGRFLVDSTANLENYFTDDPVENDFNEGNEPEIDELRIRWYWNLGNKLIPYDFGMRNHILKLKVNCCLDKLKLLQSPDNSHETDDILDQYTNEEQPDPVKKTNIKQVVMVAVICFIVILLLKPKR